MHMLTTVLSSPLLSSRYKDVSSKGFGGVTRLRTAHDIVRLVQEAHNNKTKRCTRARPSNSSDDGRNHKDWRPSMR